MNPARLAFLVVWALAAAGGVPPKPPQFQDGWSVAMHDAMDVSATSLACERIGEKQLQCVDLQWLLDALKEAKAQQEQIQERRQQQQRLWGWNKHGQEWL